MNLDEDLQDAFATLNAHLREAHARARTAELGASQRLVDGVRALDNAKTLTGVLNALVDAAQREAARTGLLVIGNGVLRGWRLHGFGAAFARAADVTLPLVNNSVIGEAVRTGAAALHDSSAAQPPIDLPPWGDGRSSIAIPLVIGGETVAVLYGDQGAEIEGGQVLHGPAWREALELLARHAARCLEVSTAIQTIRVLIDDEVVRALGRGPQGSLLRETA